MYDAAAALSQLEVRHCDLVPEKGWEVDLDSVEASADDNTVAIVIINPGNPCGSVYSYQHLEKVAETARKLGLLVISDEVYDHSTFGSKPFIRMGVFASRVPVVTLGSMSKRDGWFLAGGLVGLSQLIQMASYRNLELLPSFFYLLYFHFLSKSVK